MRCASRASIIVRPRVARRRAEEANVKKATDHLHNLRNGSKSRMCGMQH